jgi:hypothetical protein
VIIFVWIQAGGDDVIKDPTSAFQPLRSEEPDPRQEAQHCKGTMSIQLL